MSGSAAGTHLQRQVLNGPNVQRELAEFATWLNKKGRPFEALSPGCSKCSDKEKNTVIIPLLKELGFDHEDPKLRFNVFRIRTSSYINPGSGPGGYLIPIQQEPDTTELPSISNPPKSLEGPTQLVVGERVYFNRNVLVRSDFDCVVVTID
ncbi:hypothetical protein V500_00450 [Pseudogymnoascus sp. VKM F-4518 (FW-2643)]|nr:hypothetical protein V500_00450 [Pseudogymnoascus sp. VKM F-4518 (FW-2643)]